MSSSHTMLVAAFTGGFLGTLSMRALSPSFWWVGLIIGAMIGLVIKSGKEISNEIARCEFNLEPNVAEFCREVFIPSTEWLGRQIRIVMSGCAITAAGFSLLGAVILDIWGLWNAGSSLSLVPLLENAQAMNYLQWAGCYVGVIALLVLQDCMTGNYTLLCKGEFSQIKQNALISSILTTLVFPPFFVVIGPTICIVLALVLIFVIVYHAFMWTAIAYRAIAKAGPQIWNDDTYACSAACSLGALIGHYAKDNPLVGGLAGLTLALLRLKIQATCSSSIARFKR